MPLKPPVFCKLGKFEHQVLFLFSNYFLHCVSTSLTALFFVWFLVKVSVSYCACSLWQENSVSLFPQLPNTTVSHISKMPN